MRFDPHKSAAEGQEEASAGGGAVNVLVTNGELVPTVAKLLVFDMFKVALLASSRALYTTLQPCRSHSLPRACPHLRRGPCCRLFAPLLQRVVLARPSLATAHTRHTAVGKTV